MSGNNTKFKFEQRNVPLIVASLSFGDVAFMRPLSNWKQFLDAVQERPGLFWGGGERPFTSLVAFLNGYRLGFEEGSRAIGVPPSDLIPADFHKFVTERFGREFPDGGKGWMTLIEEHTGSESEAFHLFFRLRHEYASSHVKPAEPGASPNGGAVGPSGNSGAGGRAAIGALDGRAP